MPSCYTDMKQRFFNVRCIGVRNMLPGEVYGPGSLTAFKSSLAEILGDSFSNVDMDSLYLCLDSLKFFVVFARGHNAHPIQLFFNIFGDVLAGIMTCIAVLATLIQVYLLWSYSERGLQKWETKVRVFYIFCTLCENHVAEYQLL